MDKTDLYNEIEDTKLRYLLIISAESEQMSGWEDSLALLLEEAKWEFL